MLDQRQPGLLLNCPFRRFTDRRAHGNRGRPTVPHGQQDGGIGASGQQGTGGGEERCPRLDGRAIRQRRPPDLAPAGTTRGLNFDLDQAPISSCLRDGLYVIDPPQRLDVERLP
jgi:hypothetical protein